MTKKQYLKRMKLHEKQFDKLWGKIVHDTNLFVEKNENHNIAFDMFDGANVIEGFIDSICLSGAWIEDRLMDKSGIVGSKEYKKSRTKKIRKALGYTF